MTTPNLDATGHQWVGALARFNFQLEYQKAQDNTVADMLSWITTHLSLEAMWSILDGVSLGATHRAEDYDPAVVEGDQGLEKEVYAAAGWVLVEMHVTDWAKTQRKDPVLNTVLDWLEAQKKTDLKTLLGEHACSEDGRLVWRNCQNFMIHQKALYLCTTPKGREWGFNALCGPKGTSGCCSEWMSLRCRTSGPWPYLVFTAGVLLVAWDDQPDVTSHQKLHTLSTAWGQPIQGPFTPHHGYCYPRSPTCWLHQCIDHFGAKPVT